MVVRRIYGPLVLVALAIAAAAAQDLTLDEILKKNEDALGGAEAIAKVQTLKLITRIVMDGGKREASMIIRTKRPNLVRTDMMLQDKNIITAYDGTIAWMINPATGSSDPQKLDEQTAATISSSNMDTSIGSLAGFRAAGDTVESLGKADFAGSPVYRIMVTYKTGMVATYFLDATTFLPVKTIASFPRVAEDTEVEGYPADYERIAGILFAHTIDQRVGGSSIGKMIYEKIEVNEPMDDSLFKLPETKKLE